MTALLLVEDHATLGPTVASALEGSTTRTIRVTLASGANEARQLLQSQRFDVALVDLSLPDAPGAEVIAYCARCEPALPAIAFTVSDEREAVMNAVRAGAAGYVLKDEPIARVLEQIMECLDGGTPISSRAARHLFGSRRAAASVFPPSTLALTPRERELLTALARGLTYPECAALLGVRLGTVQTYVKSLYRKLGVSTKAEAASWATRSGIAP